MQISPHISLNAVKVFVITAKNRSISRAASELNVTPSAVSHQIKNLEEALGVSLFIRSNNAIEITRWGSQFYDDATLGIQIIERSIGGFSRDRNEISLKVGISFAVRWLIPALEDFKKQFPLAKISMETFHHSEPYPNHDSDLVITYKRVTNNADYGIEILKDISRPVISPKLLGESDYSAAVDIYNIPALICTSDNWDWLYWEQKMGIEPGRIKYIHSFDSDDSAIHAAVAGLGVVLATPLATQEELRTGTLVELPFCKPLLTGHYCVVPGSRKTKLIEEFKDWLVTSLHDQE